MRRLLACLAALAPALAGCGGALAQSAPPGPPVPLRLFSSQGIWNRVLPANAELDPRSPLLVANLHAMVAAEQAAGIGPWINTAAYSLPVYTVAAGAPTVTVALRGGRRDPGLARAWRAVPLPSDAVPAAGSDHDLAVWQPATDRLWEFWRLSHEPGGWSASWGGAVRRVSAQPGVYGRRSWPGARRSWGISASSLSLAGGLVTLNQLASGTIGHALAMAVPEPRADVYALPAQRTDGTSAAPQALPEGALLRLDPKLNLAALDLPPLTSMLARAAQRYGIYITDRSPNIALYAQDPAPTGTEPFTGPAGYFGGPDPRAAMAAFPWSHLQVLRMALRRR